MISSAGHAALDPDDGIYDPRRVLEIPSGLELLEPFNRAGLLVAADVHVAGRLVARGGGGPGAAPLVALGAALAVRAPRVSHVAADLSSPGSAAPGADDQVDLDALPWPDPAAWRDALRASPLVSTPGDGSEAARPLVLDGPVLYLQRYWRDESLVAAEILARLGPGEAAGALAAAASEKDLARLFPGEASDDQRAAARVVLGHRFSVVAGGPGTGKTTAVARILAAMAERALARGERPPEVALAAPTGKASSRMEEAVRAEAGSIDTAVEVRDWLGRLPGTTLHRLLGSRFDLPGRFRHHAAHRLPHDVVVVDEASMVPLGMTARLLEALAPHAVVVLMGDPEQLVSVEAGAVLADIVGPAGSAPAGPAPAGPAPAGASPAGPAPAGASPAGPAPAGPAPAGSPKAGSAPAGPGASLSGAVAVLRRNHRFGGALADLAGAIRSGDPALVVDLLTSGDPLVRWIASPDPDGLLSPRSGPELAAVRDRLARWGAEVAAAGAEGDARAALLALRAERLLCAHRRGPTGVSIYNPAIESWIDPSSGGAPRPEWYPGRPVLVTANDYATGLYNGDAGVVVAGEQQDRLAVAFDQGPGRPPRLFSPSRLRGLETVFAMTVHKSQGSEFDRVTFVLAAPGSRLLTRELLYTAVTRARREVCLIGAAEALETAVATPVARATGLGRRLWPEPTPTNPE